MKRGQVNTGRSSLPATPDFGLLPGEWVEEAACRASDRPDDWHPGGDAYEAARQAERAITICRQCPVARQCLQFALDAGTRDLQGIHAGTTVEQRREFLRRRKERTAA